MFPQIPIQLSTRSSPIKLRTGINVQSKNRLQQRSDIGVIVALDEKYVDPCIKVFWRVRGGEKVLNVFVNGFEKFYLGQFLFGLIGGCFQNHFPNENATTPDITMIDKIAVSSPNKASRSHLQKRSKPSRHHELVKIPLYRDLRTVHQAWVAEAIRVSALQQLLFQ